MSSPTQRTIKLYRDLGYICWIVEKFIYFIKKRVDFLNCIDILAFKSTEKGVIGIQTTSDSNISSRMKKAKSNPYLSAWLSNGNRFIVVSWGKHGMRGKRKMWSPRIEELRDSDLSTFS